MLAAAMDSRGYGRRGTVPPGQRRAASAMLLGGLVAACVGVYGLVAADAPALLGLPMLVIGVESASRSWRELGPPRRCARGTARTRGALAEWAVARAGVVTAAMFAAAGWLGLAGMDDVGRPARHGRPCRSSPSSASLVAATPALTAAAAARAARPVRRDRSRAVEVAA